MLGYHRTLGEKPKGQEEPRLTPAKDTDVVSDANRGNGNRPSKGGIIQWRGWVSRYTSKLPGGSGREKVVSGESNPPNRCRSKEKLWSEKKGLLTPEQNEIPTPTAETKALTLKALRIY